LPISITRNGWEVILRALEAQHGILVERSRKIHSFSHLTFQELFVSKYIIDNASEGTIERLMNNVYEKRWHEVLLMVAGSLFNSDSFFVALFNTIDNITKESKALKSFRARIQELYILSPVQRVVLLKKGFKISLVRIIEIRE
jgi:predicted NACHT family NTPase